MSVATYTVGLSRIGDFRIRYDSPNEAVELLKAWRFRRDSLRACTACGRPLRFAPPKSRSVVAERTKQRKKRGRRRDDAANFEVCCGRFYYRPVRIYLPESFAVRTPGYAFALPYMKKRLEKRRIRSRQEFLVLPDPVYWHVQSTLTYEKTLRFASGVPMTKKSRRVLPASKTPAFYRQVQEAPLNHGSLSKRSGGKNTFLRQVAFGKRCELSARAMIVPDTDLKPNEIALPRRVVEQFDLRDRWVLLNRMPSLQPDNFVALRVAKLWEHECFGVPLEILHQINGDFDGDECNLYIAKSPNSQAECELLLNSERNAGSRTLGLKLHPCQDMLVAYRRVFEEECLGADATAKKKKNEERGERCPKFDFFPTDVRLDPSLRDTLRSVYDLKGSEKCFECFVGMRDLYLREMQERWTFGLGCGEIEDLAKTARECAFDFGEFCKRVREMPYDRLGCLLFQIWAVEYETLYHVFQMVGSVGNRGESSFWKGLDETEAVVHALEAYSGFKRSSEIWKAGYVFYKNCFCLQGLLANYEGDLVDGGRIVQKEALSSCHREALMTDKSFERHAENVFGSLRSSEEETPENASAQSSRRM